MATLGNSIRNVLAESLLGSSSPMDWDQVSSHLSSIIGSDANTERIRDHRERQEFYTDQGHSYVRDFIDQSIKDPTVKQLRYQMVDAAGFNNVTRRIISTQSTVYQDHATRSVGSDTNETYQKLQQLCRQNERARQWNHLSNLHRTLLVGFRVRNVGSEELPLLQPRIDIATPDQVRAVITSPRDPTRLEGVVFELAKSGARSPASILWTNREIAYLDSRGHIIEEPREHGFERMPWVMLRLDDDSSSVWSTFGRSLIAAHKSSWFCDVCLLKETKSATKQAVLSGDLTGLARGQASDTEAPLEIPDGVAYAVHDMSMDLSIFREASNHIVDTISSSYGIAPSVLRHQGVQSAEARDLMRVPLREMRLEQHSPLREFEKEFAHVQSMVLKRDMPELAFSTEGWHIDFSDPQTPRHGKQVLEEYEHSLRLGLTSPVKHVMSRNPDLNPSQAWEQLDDNIIEKLEFHLKQRPFQQLVGAMQGQPQSNLKSAADSDGRDDEVPPTQTGEEEK